MVEGANKLNRFLVRHKENADMNQYWYSKPTIEFMAKEVEELCGGSEAGAENAKKAAFLSTPSIYFSLKDKAVKANSKCFDVSHLNPFNVISFTIVRQSFCKGSKLCILRLQQARRHTRRFTQYVPSNNHRSTFHH